MYKRQSQDRALALRLQPDGKVLVCGSSGGEFALARYLATGALDTTFGTGGKVVLTLDPNGANCRDLSFQSDGSIIAGGNINGTLNPGVLVRLAP